MARGKNAVKAHYSGNAQYKAIKLYDHCNHLHTTDQYTAPSYHYTYVNLLEDFTVITGQNDVIEFPQGLRFGYANGIVHGWEEVTYPIRVSVESPNQTWGTYAITYCEDELVEALHDIYESNEVAWQGSG